MPKEPCYHTIITPRVPIYAYCYHKTGETFQIDRDPIVAIAFYYVRGMNFNVPLAMGYEDLEDPTNWDNFLGMSMLPDLTVEDWKQAILEREDQLKRKMEREQRMQRAGQNGSGEDLQP